jgi:LCP family protein required for cell wall assembly
MLKMHRIRFLLIMLTASAVTSVACSAVDSTPSPTPIADPSPQALHTPTFTPTASATPAQTASPIPSSTVTARPTETDTPIPTNTPTPTTTPGGPGPLPTFAPIDTPDPSAVSPAPTTIPTPVPLLQQPADTVNVLLMGSDELSDDSGWRTDSLIVVSVDPNLPSISMLSIPRDLYVYVPGWKMSRVNTADSHGKQVGYPGGGPGLLKATLEYNLGIQIHYYARVDFEGFVKLVDTLGGIDVVVDCELQDTFPDPEAEDDQTDIDLEPGVHHLDGKSALWYTRSRWNTNDYDRGRRQQRVLRGMWAQIKQLGLVAKLPELWDDLTQTVQTDLSLDNMLWLAAVASRLDTDTAIKSRFIDGTVVQSWLTPEGAQVLLPDYERIGPLIADALAPPETSRARQVIAQVEVLNGTVWSDWAVLAADRLLWEGFEVVRIGQADRADYQQTLIVNLTETAKGSPVSLLARILRVSGADIVPADEPDTDADFRVIVGHDYQPCYKSYWYAVHTTPTPTPTPTP